MFSFRRVITSVVPALLCLACSAFGSPGGYRFLDLPAEGRASVSECFGEAGGLKTIQTSGKLSAAGVPFSMGSEASVTDLKKAGNLTLKLGSPAFDVFVLATSRVTDHDTKDHWLWSSSSDDSYFHALIRYSDGVTEEAVPTMCPSGRHYAADWMNEYKTGEAAITIDEDGKKKGIFVYRIAPGRPALIETIVLMDMSERFSLAVLAATIDTRPAVSREPGYAVPKPKGRLNDTKNLTHISRNGDALNGACSRMYFSLDLSNGASLSEIGSYSVLKKIIEGSESPIFKAKIGDRILSAADFRASSVENISSIEAVVKLEPIDPEVPVSYELSLKIEGPDTLRMGLTAVAKKNCSVQTTFPLVGGIAINGDASDDKYFFPNKGGLIHSRPIKIQKMYGGWGAQVQFIDLWDENAGGGITLWVEDTTNTYKVFELDKMVGHKPFVVEKHRGNFHLPTDADPDATAIAIHYETWNFDKEERHTLPTAVLQVHEGDWRDASKLYLAWVKTWYTSDHPEWPRKMFISRGVHPAQFIKDGKYFFDPVGYEDVLIIFGWWVGDFMRGDYDYKPGSDDPAALRKLSEEIRSHGVRAQNYVEGVWCEEVSRTGKKHGKQWGIMKPDGSYSDMFSKYNMCQALPQWQDYMVETADRIVGDLDLDSYYIDCSARVYADCFNPAHDHKTPGVFVSGAGEMFKKIHDMLREKYGKNITLSSEEPGSDVTCQWLDQAFSYVEFYKLNEMPRELNPSGVNMFRFLFPDVKLFEIMGDSNKEGGRLAFFNATGVHDMFLEPTMQDFWKRLARAFHQHEDAFSSLDVEPLVPTLREGLYANGFYCDYERVYTLFNANYRTLRGEMISLPYIEGAVYTDIFTHKEYKTVRDGDYVKIIGEMAPRDVTAVVVTLPE